jgi:hypothetical protein
LKRKNQDHDYAADKLTKRPRKQPQRLKGLSIKSFKKACKTAVSKSRYLSAFRHLNKSKKARMDLYRFLKMEMHKEVGLSTQTSLMFMHLFLSSKHDADPEI